MIDATPLLRLYADRRARRLAAMDAVEAQQHQLLGLVREARDTRFGRDHDFDGVWTVEDFQERVPLRRWEDFWRDYWRHDFPTLENVTWPGRIPYFAVTSGTTAGATKHIPVSKAMVASNRKAALDVLAFHLQARPKSRVWGGPNFMLGGSTRLEELAPGILAGDLSGIAAREVPRWARPFYFPPGKLAEITDWEEKVRVLGRAALDADIRNISGTASWLLLFFEHLREVSKGGRLVDWWPNLELVVHGGVNFAPYRARFERLLEGSHAELREVYPASEGFLAAADRGTGEGLRLMADIGIFYEFVPVEELDSPNPRRHWLRTVQPGVNYAVVMSTCAGLWAHVLGDTVRFVDTAPPRLLVTGRTSYMLSAFGEHLIGEEIEQAVTTAAEAIGAELVDYSVGAVFPEDAPAGHLYIVEFAGGPPPPERLRAFAEAVDARLCALNDDYRAHRAGDFGMAAPRVQAVASGVFAEWMASRGKLGGQNKVPRVITDEALFRALREFPDRR